jgi:hypothetical protein
MKAIVGVKPSNIFLDETASCILLIAKVFELLGCQGSVLNELGPACSNGEEGGEGVSEASEFSRGLNADSQILNLAELRVCLSEWRKSLFLLNRLRGSTTTLSPVI